MAWGAARGGSRPAAIALILIAAVVLGLALLRDLPETKGTGAVGIAFEGASAKAGPGFGLEVAAGALLAGAGGACPARGGARRLGTASGAARTGRPAADSCPSRPRAAPALVLVTARQACRWADAPSARGRVSRDSPRSSAASPARSASSRLCSARSKSSRLRNGRSHAQPWRRSSSSVRSRSPVSDARPGAASAGGSSRLLRLVALLRRLMLVDRGPQVDPSSLALLLHEDGATGGGVSSRRLACPLRENVEMADARSTLVPISASMLATSMVRSVRSSRSVALRENLTPA